MSVFSISMQLMLRTMLCSAWLNSAPVCSFLLHSPLLYYPYSTLLILCSAQSAHNCTHALNTLQRSSCNRFLQVVHCKHLNSALQSNRHQCRSHTPQGSIYNADHVSIQLMQLCSAISFLQLASYYYHNHSVCKGKLASLEDALA